MSEGRQAAKQGDIREQAHRRGTHHLTDASAPSMTIFAPCLARSNRTAVAYRIALAEGCLQAIAYET